ncbi:MAG: Crp/Fnr family transcriptional regulator [Chitinophagales bacterium]
MTSCGQHDICFRKAPLFAGLPEEDQCRIHQLVRQRQYGTGELIIQEGETGEGLYIVRRGTVKLYKASPAGKEQVVAFLRYGDLFGERTLLLGEPVGVSAEAVEPSVVCLIPKEEFTALLRTQPDLSLALARYLASRVELAVGLIGHLGLQDARERLLTYLSSLAEGAGRPAAGGVEIELPASRAEIGKLLGMTPETVSRRLAELEDEGLLTAKGRRTLVLRRPTA